MGEAIGSSLWVIPEGYIPGGAGGRADRALTSHEAACMLNTSDERANVEIMLYFTDRERVGPYRVSLEARRTLHLRLNDLDDPEPIPLDTDYASIIRSDVPIMVRHTRLDARPEAIALLSTIAFPG